MHAICIQPTSDSTAVMLCVGGGAGGFVVASGSVTEVLECVVDLLPHPNNKKPQPLPQHSTSAPIGTHLQPYTCPVNEVARRKNCCINHLSCRDSVCSGGAVADRESLPELQPEVMRKQERTACDEIKPIREGGGPCSSLVDVCCGRSVLVGGGGGSHLDISVPGLRHAAFRRVISLLDFTVGKRTVFT